MRGFITAKVIQYYQRSGDKKIGGLACKARGCAYLHLGNYDSAFSNLKQGIALFKAGHDTTELMFIYLNLAHAYSANSQFGKSTECVLSADSLAGISGNLKARAGVKNQMGILFREQQQYPKAIGYFKEAIENYRQIRPVIPP